MTAPRGSARELAAVLAAIGEPPGEDAPAADVLRGAWIALTAVAPTLSRLRGVATMFSTDEQLERALAALQERARVWSEAAERAAARSRRV